MYIDVGDAAENNQLMINYQNIELDNPYDNFEVSPPNSKHRYADIAYIRNVTELDDEEVFQWAIEALFELKNRVIG